MVPGMLEKTDAHTFAEAVQEFLLNCFNHLASSVILRLLRLQRPVHNFVKRNLRDVGLVVCFAFCQDCLVRLQSDRY